MIRRQVGKKATQLQTVQLHFHHFLRRIANSHDEAKWREALQV